MWVICVCDMVNETLKYIVQRHSFKSKYNRKENLNKFSVDGGKQAAIPTTRYGNKSSIIKIFKRN